MYLRALGSLLTRRFSPRGIPRTRAQPQAWAQESFPGMFSRPAIGATAARPTRSFHTDRDLAIDGGPVFYVIMAGMGFGGFMFLKKGEDESGDELTDGETSKEIVDLWDPKLYGKECAKDYDLKDEATMKERFEQWMKQYNRTYRTEEEKAMRYERFKMACWHVANPNRFADWTADEFERYNNCQGIDLEQYNAEIKAKIAEMGDSD